MGEPRGSSLRSLFLLIGLPLLLEGTAAQQPARSSPPWQSPGGVESPRSVEGVLIASREVGTGLALALNGIRCHNATLLPLSTEAEKTSSSPLAVEFRLPPLLPGQYLFEVLHPQWVLPKYRLVVDGQPPSADGEGERESLPAVRAFPLNDQLLPSSTEPMPLPLRIAPTGPSHYAPATASFSLLGVLQQPTVILVLVSLCVMYFLPKMQEEQLAEERLQLEQQQQQRRQEPPASGALSDGECEYAQGEASPFLSKLLRSHYT